MKPNTIKDITDFIFLGKDFEELSHYDLLIINADWVEEQLAKDMKLMLDKNIIDNNTTFIICEGHGNTEKRSASILIDYLKKEGLTNKIIISDKYISNPEILRNIDKLVDITKYKEGMRIYHKKFGEGIIQKIEAEGDDYKLDIQFDKSGHKRLMAKFANLEII